MSALPRPDLPPGPHRDLVDALHDLHHRAGWPSLRQLARCGRLFAHHHLQDVLLADPAELGHARAASSRRWTATPTEFHDLWLDASRRSATPTRHEPLRDRRPPDRARRGTSPSRERRRTAARQRRGRHGQDHAGRRQPPRASDTFVATGHCLPLSTQVPFLPIADVLRAVYDVDDGALARRRRSPAAAPYVADSLRLAAARARPLGQCTSAGDGAWSRQRLFTAVGVDTGARSASTRPLRRAARGPALGRRRHPRPAWSTWLASGDRRSALTGTWRVDDPATPSREARVVHTGAPSRSPTAALDLGAAQPRRDPRAARADLGRAAPRRPRRADPPAQPGPTSVHRAARRADPAKDQPLPRLLGDLLDQRLDGLAGDCAQQWRVCLAVADRALTDPPVARR